MVRKSVNHDNDKVCFDIDCNLPLQGDRHSNSVTKIDHLKIKIQKKKAIKNYKNLHQRYTRRSRINCSLKISHNKQQFT